MDTSRVDGVNAGRRARTTSCSTFGPLAATIAAKSISWAWSIKSSPLRAFFRGFLGNGGGLTFSVSTCVES
jgi:hypothetical protein